MKIFDKVKKTIAQKGKSAKSVAKRKVHKYTANLPDTAAVPPDLWWRRWLWYAHPKRFKDFWFTKPGLRAATRITGVMAGLAVLFVAGLFLYFSKDLPSPGQINARTLEQSTKFYDRTGQVMLYELYGDKNRSVVKLDVISDHLEHATIAVEDEDFYRHGAFSSIGIIRAAVNNVLNRENGVQGGSTITQQYVKNALLTGERTFTRKIKELILSIQIEQLYKKNDILELYLNEIPYGTLAYGAQAASKTFFDKDAKDLTIDEAAMLAALPRAPTFYSPYGENTADLTERQHTIINLMQEQGYITKEQADEAKKVDTLAKINPSPNLYADIKAPHFVLYVQQLLERKYGIKEVREGGFNVVTSLDWGKQQIAEEAVKNNISKVDRLGGDNAALVAEEVKTGQVLAMVGSRDFRHPGYGSFNAALAGRQPGSSFKPYVYATLFKEQSWGPGSTMYDVATDFGAGYRPNNFDFRFKGIMPIRQALGESRNIPAVKALYIVGVDNAIDQAHKMGITTLNDGAGAYGLSLVLGAGEVKLADHVHGYRTFGNSGKFTDQAYILKVTDQKGKVLEEWKEKDGEQVLDEEIASAMTDILSDDAARVGTFGRANRNVVVPGLTAAAKTGTTDQSRDGWMMGYTTRIAAGVWVGRHDNKAMNSITSDQTGPIWTEFMRRAHEGQPDEKFTRHPKLKTVTIDKNTGRLPNERTSARTTDIFPSWYKPQGPASIRTAVIDIVSNKLATDCTPPNTRKEISETGIQAEIPSTDPAFGRWNPPVQALAGAAGQAGGGTIPTASDDIHKCSDQKADIKDFNVTKKSGGSIEFNFDIESGTHPARNIAIRNQGQIIWTKDINGSTNNEKVVFPVSGGNNTYTFEITVTDAAQYIATETEAVNYTGGGSGFIPPNNQILSFVTKPFFKASSIFLTGNTKLLL